MGRQNRACDLWACGFLHWRVTLMAPARTRRRFSKDRRLEPQITIGLLTNQAGFPLW
jgi:hypothetical protein